MARLVRACRFNTGLGAPRPLFFRGRPSFATRNLATSTQPATWANLAFRPPRPRRPSLHATHRQICASKQHLFMSSSTDRPPDGEELADGLKILPNTERPSDAEALAEELGLFNQSKWGWVIYRTTYGDDEAWERFKVLVTRYCRAELEEPDVPRAVVDALEWTFVSDQKTLDGASRDTLRQHFVAWAAEAEPRERLPGPLPRYGADEKSSRYKYFVQVDEESLRSVVDANISDWRDPGYVNLVRCEEGLDYNRTPGRLREREEYIEEWGGSDDDYDPEDWIMITACTLSVGFYVNLGSWPQGWYGFYSQPPNWVVY